MADIIFDKEKCKGCELCVSVCPIGIIKMSDDMNKNGFHYAVVDKEKCTGCGMCFRMCPDMVIEIEK